MTDDRGRAETGSRIGASRPGNLLAAYRESPERRAARALILGARETTLGGLAGGSLSFFLAFTVFLRVPLPKGVLF